MATNNEASRPVEGQARDEGDRPRPSESTRAPDRHPCEAPLADVQAHDLRETICRLLRWVRVAQRPAVEQLVVRAGDDLPYLHKTLCYVCGIIADQARSGPAT